MDDGGTTTRYHMIIWRGSPCFWWYRDQILCSGADDAQQLKLAQMARALNAFAVGDDGERYEIRKSIFGKENEPLSSDSTPEASSDSIVFVVLWECEMIGKRNNTRRTIANIIIGISQCSWNVCHSLCFFR
jgi:hypothetical protein